VKIKCLKAECEICNVVGIVQLFFNNLGVLGYGRVRHCVGLEKGRPIFEYHSQLIKYLSRKIAEVTSNADLLGQSTKTNADQKELVKSLEARNK
jgi:hypothetical protein